MAAESISPRADGTRPSTRARACARCRRASRRLVDASSANAAIVARVTAGPPDHAPTPVHSPGCGRRRSAAFVIARAPSSDVKRPPSVTTSSPAPVATARSCAGEYRRWWPSAVSWRGEQRLVGGHAEQHGAVGLEEVVHDPAEERGVVLHVLDDVEQRDAVEPRRRARRPRARPARRHDRARRGPRSCS